MKLERKIEEGEKKKKKKTLLQPWQRLCADLTAGCFYRNGTEAVNLFFNWEQSRFEEKKKVLHNKQFLGYNKGKKEMLCTTTKQHGLTLC